MPTGAEQSPTEVQLILRSASALLSATPYDRLLEGGDLLRSMAPCVLRHFGSDS